MPVKKTYGQKKSTAAPSSAAIFGKTPSPPKPQPVDDLTEQLSRFTIDESNPLPPPSLPILSTLNLEIQDWSEILPEKCTVTKIAEASFSEVYRITTGKGPDRKTSIIKILPLKVPHDPESSTRTYAQNVKDVVSELKIMDSLTDIPGFVTFKGAHLAIGAPSLKFVKAWEKYHKNREESEFCNPGEYGEQATFLVIELGDAGKVLDDFPVNTADRVWDIFLGAVIALSRAEMTYKFEHRDLHENNICVKLHPVTLNLARRHREPGPDDRPPPVFGRAGVEITIIDYGLSRAQLSHRKDRVYFKDLEEDMEVFQGDDGHPQFDAYRKMRNHLFNKQLHHEPRSWHTHSSKNMNWAKHTPFSNVIWLGYLFNYLSEEYRKKEKKKEEYDSFVKKSRFIRDRFECDGVRKNAQYGPFYTVADVLDWVLYENLVTVGDLDMLDDEGSFFN